ncbi:TerD family protein [Gordonia sp. TBRC 11910]|uniref:TerD family protein n=1 Tax=Gordonia asplenii TaxID=2725283 RepID=A0A848L3G2_9ACTN|nr:TerD family protein [Gordonia asplenii]NMO02188.1 TerD family protein [Gordonia asplenii]
MVHILMPGSNVELQQLGEGVDEGAVAVRVAQADGECPFDVSVLILDDDRKVRSNDDFVFYNQPTALDGAIQLCSQEQGGSGIDLDIPKVPSHANLIVVAASVYGEGATFGDLPDITLTLGRSDGQGPLASFQMSGLTTESAVVLCELYRRNDRWKIRAVGQGYNDGLGALATDFGVEVDESGDEDTDAPASPTDGAGEEPVPTPVVDARQASEESAGTKMVVGRKKRPAKLPNDWSDFTTPFLRAGSDAPFRRARLFPVVGIKSAAEQEMRATSVLLSVMEVVKEFGRAVTSKWGAPGGKIETFTEVRFSHGGDDLRPDGMVRISRGARVWTALVEVKTGKNNLKADQVEKYLKLAKSKDFDAVVTISSDLLPAADDVAVEIDARHTKNIALLHISWEELIAEASMLNSHIGVSEATRARVLADFLTYALEPASGMAVFDDMGATWVKVREAVKDRTLRADGGAVEVCNGYDRLLRHLALQLSSLTGQRVVAVVPANRPDAVSRARQLADSGELFGTLRVSGATGAIVVNADLRTERITCSMPVGAPRSGRPATKVNWLVRQLGSAPDAVRLTAHHSGSRTESTAVMLGALRGERGSLVPPDDKDVREFTVAMETSMGTKRSGSSGGFVAAAVKLLNVFYEEVVQTVRSGNDR